MPDLAVNLAVLAGAIQIGFVFAIVLWTAVLFVFGVPIAWFHVPLAAVSSAGFGWWVAARLFPSQRAQVFTVTYGCSALAFCLFALLESALYDVSWDGQAYHAEAILALAGGWNPFRGELSPGLDWTTYLTFYPRGPWICAAAVYKLTGSIDAGKAFHLLLMTACWLFAYAAMSGLPGLTKRWAFVVSSLLAFNPISLAQMHTYYVDGLLASLLTITVSLLIAIDTRPNRVLMMVLACVVVLTMNVKLNGPIYLGIILGGFWVSYAIRKKAGGLELAASVLAGGIVGAGLVGFNPFVSEFIGRLWTDGYRFLLSDWMSLLAIAREPPVNFESINRFGKLLASLFSMSAVLPAGEPSQLKVPFVVSMSEIQAFDAPDVRVGGFGPLFSGALIVECAMLAVLAIRYRRDLMTNSVMVLAALAVLSAFPNQEMWWARFAPQLWLASVLVLTAGVSLAQERGRWLAAAVGATLLFNVAIVFVPNALAQYPGSQQVVAQMAALKRQSQPIAVQFNRFAATRYRFQHEGVRYLEVDTLPCSQGDRVRVERSETFFCRE